MAKATDVALGQTYLLAIRGTLIPSEEEAARKIHNETAGNEAGVAAARSLGDLSHKVFVPAKGIPGDRPANELLILDVWNNIEGLNTFFANPQVQHGGSLIFKSRDPVVFTPAPDLLAFNLPAPMPRQARYVGTVRGMVKSREQARATLNASTAKAINSARKRGLVSHNMYYRLGQPGQPDSLELFGVDVWFDLNGMGEHYAAEGDLMKELFVSQPSTGIWEQPGGTWVEW